MFDPVYRALENVPCASTVHMWRSEAHCVVSPLCGFQGWSPGLRLVQHTLCPTGILFSCPFVVPKDVLTDPVTGV